MIYHLILTKDPRVGVLDNFEKHSLVREILNCNSQSEFTELFILMIHALFLLGSEEINPAIHTMFVYNSERLCRYHYILQKYDKIS